MGCEASRMLPEEEVGRRRRSRDSIELLCPDAGNVDSGRPPRSASDGEEILRKEEEEGRKLRKGRRGGSTGEELPGSPSFRVYCVRSASASVDFDSAAVDKRAEKAVTEPKPAKKNGTRLRVLVKAHIASNHWLKCYREQPAAAALPYSDSPRFLASSGRHGPS